MLINKVAYPKEHGAWGFVLEPLILALIVAFSTNGLLLAIASFILFIANQPLKIILNKSVAPKLKSVAIKFLAFYSSIFLILFGYIFTNSLVEELLPYFVAIFLMLLFLFAERNNHERKLLFEFLPPIALTLMSVSILLMNTSFKFGAMYFAIVLLSRSIPTVIYVNAKVKEAKRKDFSKATTHLANSVFALLIFLLGWYSLLPELSFVASILLLVRSVIGFSKFNFTKSVMQIGIAEFIYGSLFVLINAIAFLI